MPVRGAVVTPVPDAAVAPTPAAGVAPPRAPSDAGGAPVRGLPGSWAHAVSAATLGRAFGSGLRQRRTTSPNVAGKSSGNTTDARRESVHDGGCLVSASASVTPSAHT